MPLLSPVSDAGDQQQFHQERNIRHPENSFEEVLEQLPASLPSIPLSPRPASSRQPTIIQQSSPINQQSSAALVPPANASVVISHHEESPYRDLSHNIADQDEDASNVDSLPQTALEEDTQEANKTFTEKSSRRQSISSSLQGPKAPAEADLPSKRGVVGTQASAESCEKELSTVENEKDGDLSAAQKLQYEQKNSTAEKIHNLTTEDDKRVKISSSDLDKRKPSAQEKIPTNIDLRSDSGYSSYTVATVSSTNSSQNAPSQYHRPQVARAATRTRSPRSNIAAYRIDDSGIIPIDHQVSNSENNEIRLRLDTSGPLSLQLNGNMNGRTMQLIPGENGMAELIISGGDTDLCNDQQERRRQNRKPIVYQIPTPASESSSEYDSEEDQFPFQKQSRDEAYESHDEYWTETSDEGAVIQPATTKQRRPTVSRPIGYLTGIGQQDYSGNERARGREWQQPIYKVGSRRVGPNRSDISPYPTRVTGQLYSSKNRPPPPKIWRRPTVSEKTRPPSIWKAVGTFEDAKTLRPEREHPRNFAQYYRHGHGGPRGLFQLLEEHMIEIEGMNSERQHVSFQERDEKSKSLKSQQEGKPDYWDPRAGNPLALTRRTSEATTPQKQPGKSGYWHSFYDSESGLSTPSICSSDEEDTAIFDPAAPSANEARKLSGESSPNQIPQDIPIAAVEVRTVPEFVAETPRKFAFENMKDPSDTQSLLPNDPNPGLKVHEGDSEPPSPTSQHPQPTSDLENSQQARVAPNTPTSIEAFGNIMTRSNKEIVLPSTTVTPVTDNSIPSLITVKGGDCASESVSVPPSHAAMVAPISVESLPSLTSGISKSDGYSSVEIAAATKVLLSVLYEDDGLMRFCELAIENQNIGRERLQKKLRHSLRACAARLYENAKITTKRVEYLTARLIHAKSTFLAQYIVITLLDKRENTQSLHYECSNESSEEEDDRRSIQHSIEKVFSNETFRKFMENDRIDLDPWVEEDLCTLREIVASSAVGYVTSQVVEFVAPNLPRTEWTETVVEATSSCDATSTNDSILMPLEQFKTSTWHEWFRDSKQTLDAFTSGAYHRLLTIGRLYLTLDTMLHARNQLLVAMGLLEPALDQNKVRLRWPCCCGDSIYSDVIEVSEGGITELVDRMQRSSGVKVHAAPYNRQSSNQQYIVPRPDRWLRNALTKVGMTFGGPSKSPPSCLPQHNSPYATTSCSTSTSSSPTKKILHLSMCMHRTRQRKIVKQDRIDDITTDRTLLCFLQRQYATHRGRFLNIARLKTVQRIVFVKFRLPMGGSVDVQHHLYCIADPANWRYCECTPPPNKVGVEYEYSPSPPKTHPPIPPEYLASLFTCATDVHEEDDWILNQLPKRTCGVLQGQKGQPAEGWGIYFLEGWDREIISLLILFIFFLASLLFGVLWWKFQFDLQGGFGVSAYMMAVCTIVISVVVTRLENKG
ncbi:unnamed protein product [Alternaria sp. RS040]